MMPIGKLQDAIILLAASSALLAQSNDLVVRSQNHWAAPDVRGIVNSSIAATQRHWQVRLQYTYMERDENRRLDLAGRVKSEDVDVSRTVLARLFTRSSGTMSDPSTITCHDMVMIFARPPLMVETSTTGPGSISR